MAKIVETTTATRTFRLDVDLDELRAIHKALGNDGIYDNDSPSVKVYAAIGEILTRIR